MTKKPVITSFRSKGYAPSGAREDVRVTKAGKRIKPHAAIQHHEMRTVVFRKALRRAYKRAAEAEPACPATEDIRKRRVFGAYKGKFSVGPEFFEPLSPEELKAWGEE
jgi:hypothetical protein